MDNLFECDIDIIRSDLCENGVAVARSIYSKEEVNELRRAILETGLEANPDAPFETGGKIEWVSNGDKRWPGLMFWPAFINKGMDDIRFQDKFVKLMRGLLGDNIRQLNNQVYFRLPGDGDEFNIHQDIVFRTDIDDWELAHRSYLQTIIAVDAVDAANGGVEFYLGSHKRDAGLDVSPERGNLRTFDEDIRDQLVKDFEPKIFDLQPGDVMMWNLGIAHGSRANCSNSSRTVYMNGFARAEISDYWPYFLKEGQPEPLFGHCLAPFVQDAGYGA